MDRCTKRLTLADEDRVILEAWLAARSTPQALARRSRIVLLAADGITNRVIAQITGVSIVTVREWRKRYAAEGLASLTRIRSGRGRKRIISPREVEQIVHDTLHLQPRGTRYWTCRAMAHRHQVSPATIQRIWDAYGLKPNRAGTSNDSAIDGKFRGIVGLYVNPPDKAAAICVDESSSVHVLDGARDSSPGADYMLDPDAAPLSVALGLLDRTVIGNCYERRRRHELLKFLRRLDRAFPYPGALHLLVDKRDTFERSVVRGWLKNHARFCVHSIPNHETWASSIEGWLEVLSNATIRRSLAANNARLTQEITRFIKAYDEEPRFFSWTAASDA